MSYGRKRRRGDLKSGAEGGIRTLTPLRELRPERSASASSATSALSTDGTHNELLRSINVGVIFYSISLSLQAGK